MKGSVRHGIIYLTQQAWDEMIVIADRADSIETGGILLGYGSGRAVRVVGVAEVADPDATETSFTLRRDAAQARLDEVRGHFPEGSPVGFVGDWHVHPRNSPPSSVDRRSMARLGRLYRRRMVGIVVVREGARWVPHGLAVTWAGSRTCAIQILEIGEVQ